MTGCAGRPRMTAQAGAAKLLQTRGNMPDNVIPPQIPTTPVTAEVLEQLRAICYDKGIAIVPQAGNTGLMGGATPWPAHRGIVLSVGRMNKVLSVDPVGYSMTVESGCILQTLQETAAANDRFFPLSLGAQGSCQIGGNLSTNAGGVQVLRYGNARNLVLGLEVVLPN